MHSTTKAAPTHIAATTLPLGALIALSALSALIALSAHARILNVPEDFAFIQRGIDAAEEGDTVLVAPGCMRKI